MQFLESWMNAASSPLAGAVFERPILSEEEHVQQLLASVDLSPTDRVAIEQHARKLVALVRSASPSASGIDALMQHYNLSTNEGVVLMCIAEAILRIPDAATQKQLINDKLSGQRWNRHIGDCASGFVHLVTWGLALTGKVLSPSESKVQFVQLWRRLVQRSSEPVIRRAVIEAIQVMSQHFVVGRTLPEAIKKTKKQADQGYHFSFDMLGEAAQMAEDAETYDRAYHDAIAYFEQQQTQSTSARQSSISVKLSALYPRYEWFQQANAVPAVSARLLRLCLAARRVGIPLTVDAEESERLILALRVVEQVFWDPQLDGWHDFGMAVQAYQVHAVTVVDALIAMARRRQQRLRIRLVKGAYWDTEIKRAQVLSYPGFPVYTRKSTTDLSYLICADRLLAAKDVIYPQFATHNAHTVAAVLFFAKRHQTTAFSCQKLQGMGTTLHDQLVADGIRCSVYAPVGHHQALLPYLVRRLLENGANSAFVQRIADSSVSVDALIEDPIAITEQLTKVSHPKIVAPKDLFQPRRPNSPGIDWTYADQLNGLTAAIKAASATKPWFASRAGIQADASDLPVHNPATGECIGYCREATEACVMHAMTTAVQAQPAWDGQGAAYRANVLRKMADLMEEQQGLLLCLLVEEAGKVLRDALDEWREAIDFCRYYAHQADTALLDQWMPGPTGESNLLMMRGRGVVACISPWNFPVAIFVGQIAAALVSGNAVLAKPAEQTPLVAAALIHLFYEAGVPKAILHGLPGVGPRVGQWMVGHPQLDGVVFTGSTATAKQIQRDLAQRDGPIVPLIAETGGINAMIVDSSALAEQVVRDVIASAFGAAGQRCSALRLLCLQEDIADDVIARLAGAMQTLEVGDPSRLVTDIGPVIDETAYRRLAAHSAWLHDHAQHVATAPLNTDSLSGHFIAPQAFVLQRVDDLKEEFFGPILHIIRYPAAGLHSMVEAINRTGYGLTFGVHSRINHTIEQLLSLTHAGNVYVNRNMIGAVVGVQPFGGHGLSGTGPKAGGPLYLQRLCREMTVSIDTTAAGGNAALMALQDDR